MFAVHWMITSTTIHFIFILCIQNCLLCFGLPSYNRHMSCVTESFIEKYVGFEDISRVSGWQHALWLELFPARLASFIFFFFPSKSFLWDLWWWDISHLLRCGDGWEAGGALEPWESVVGALPSFLGMALEEPLQLLSPLSLLGLPSKTPVDFREVSPRHTFLRLCKAKEDTKACFRHFSHL